MKKGLPGGLPEGQLWILAAVERAVDNGADWSGTSQQARAALIAKGLIVFKSKRPEEQHHRRFATYAITDTGRDVLMAERFELGLAYGHDRYVVDLTRAAVAQARAEEEEAFKADVEAGERYARDVEATAAKAVRKVIWAGVERKRTP